jgi:hypothetical protein
VILLDPVVPVLALPHLERLGVRTDLQARLAMAQPRGLKIGLAAVDGDLLEKAVSFVGLADEGLGILEVTRWREQEIDGGA